MSEAFYNPGAAGERARRIPLWRWALWYLCLGLAMVLFYVVLTPIWLGLRGAAWTAELRARRKAS